MKNKKTIKIHKFRDTVPVRTDRAIKEEIKRLSKQSHETMSQIIDWALREYIRSVKSQD